MQPYKLDYSLKLNSTKHSFTVSEKIHPFVQVYTFKTNNKNVMIYVCPNKKMIVAISGDEITEVFSNAKLIKTSDKSFDVDMEI